MYDGFRRVAYRWPRPIPTAIPGLRPDGTVGTTLGQDSSITDHALLEAWRGGDRDAAEKLLGRHFATVYRYFLARLGSHATSDAEDLTQRTFEACVVGRERVRTDMRAYLYGVARRLLMQEWKRRRVRGEVITPSQADLEARGRTPSSALRRADAWELLSDALSELPLEFSSVLERFFLEEQSIAIIAEELGIAKGTVKSRLHRGKAMLRKELTRIESNTALRESSLEIVAKRDED